MKRALIGLALAGALALAAARSLGTSAAASQDSGSTVVRAGPVLQTAPLGAVIAENELELSRLLGLAEGPNEIWLRARTYRGDFRVRRKLGLRGESGATLFGTGRGTVLSLEADGIEVENLIVQNSGRRHTREDAGIRAKAARVTIRRVRVLDALFGVSLGPCTGCRLEQSEVRGSLGERELAGDAIKLWEAHDAVVRDCVVEGSRDVVVWYSRGVLLEGNSVTASRYGTHFMHANGAVVRRSRLVGNVVGIFVMYSSGVRLEQNVLAGARGAAGIGIGFKESDDVVVRESWLVANTVGAYLDRTPRSVKTPVHFEKNVLALNDTALRFHSSEEGVRFTANDFFRNRSTVEVEGGGDALGTRFAKNHWSDYAGYDLDRDGTGDVPYEIQRLSSSLLEAAPAVRLFEGSLSLGLIDLLARAFPVFATERLLVDEHPRMLFSRRRQ